MKKLSLLLIAILCSFTIIAQDLFYTNFQTEDDFQQWTVVDNNADDCTWKFEAAASPSFVFYSYHSTNAADDWFISPAITSTVSGTLAVNFSVQGSSYGEKIEVFYGTEPTLDAMTNRATDVINLGNEITGHTFLVNVTANEPIHLGFHACSDADKWRIYLCEVKAQFTDNPVDIHATEFVSPVSGFNLSQETVTVKVKNSGNIDVESFDISFSVDETLVATETVEQLLVAGAEIEYTFNTKADLSEARKRFSLKAWTSHPNDVNVTNDACYTEVLHKAPASVPYTTSFEANEYTDGISFFNLNEDDGDWTLYSDPWWSLAHTGDYCLAYNYDKNNNGDDWAILEPITIEEAGYYVLKFWYSGDDSHPEKLRVCYGNDATPAAMTNQIVEYAPFAHGAYEESINILYIEQPQDICIGFYAFSDKDENWLCVDDVSFEKVDNDAIDVAALPITNPSAFVHQGTKKDIEFEVRNLGISDVTSVVSVKIDDNIIYEQNVNILAQEIKPIVITNALADVVAGEHIISVDVITENDNNETNNTQSTTFRIMGTPALSWDFEDGELPSDFTFRTEDEGTVNPGAGSEFNEYGWGIFNIQEHELYGEHLLAGTSWLDGTEQADRWCILPPFKPEEESFLVWDAASFNPYFLEDYAIMISSNGDDSWYYFTEESYTSESEDFKTRGLSLSDYSGQEIYIAFRLRSKNCEHLILDNIELYGGEGSLPNEPEVGDAPTAFDPAAQSEVKNELRSFTIIFNEEDYPNTMSFAADSTAQVYEDNELITLGNYSYADENHYNIIVTFDEPITEPGTYTIKVGKGHIFENETGKLCPAFEVTYTLYITDSIEELFLNIDSFTVHTINGICIMRDAKADEVKNLKSGLYIINGNKVFIQ